MAKFIEQYKTTGYDSDGFKILREKTDNPRTLLFLEIAEQVYHYYQGVLKQRNQIDFADMINDAHYYLQEIERQNISLPYRYIIIDEFQDIARQRFNLTKRLSEIKMCIRDRIDSTLHKLRETVRTLEGKENPSRYKSQITLANRRIQAFGLAVSLIERELEQLS